MYSFPRFEVFSRRPRRCIFQLNIAIQQKMLIH